MKRITISRPGPVRVSAMLIAGAFALGGITPIYGQIRSIPAQQPSNLPASGTTSQPPQYYPAQPPPAPAAQSAKVTYSGGQLRVVAENSSLNQILREISRQTGMKITGGVTDERVFGTYGPALPGKILATLLDGTGSNMLLVQSPSDKPDAAPVELVLTPRHGGPTPPNPNAGTYSENPYLAPSEPQTDASHFRQPPPHLSVPTPDTSQPTSAAAPTSEPPPAPPASDTTTEQSPNGVKTPQQIYEQLLKLRNQSQPPQQ